MHARLLLQLADHAEKVLGLRVAARTEHADQALDWRAPSGSWCAASSSTPPAYWLVLITVRDAIPKVRDLATAKFNTIRLRLLKIAAPVIETASRVRLAFAAACPDADLFRGMANALILKGPDSRGLIPPITLPSSSNAFAKSDPESGKKTEMIARTLTQAKSVVAGKPGGAGFSVLMQINGLHPVWLTPA